MPGAALAGSTRATVGAGIGAVTRNTSDSTSSVPLLSTKRPVAAPSGTVTVMRSGRNSAGVRGASP